MNKPDAAPINPVPREHDLIDETSDESFPASDPPGWSLLHVGAPRQRADTDDGARTPKTPSSTDESP